jgi:hypothetical protein
MESRRQHRSDSAGIRALINAHPGLTYAAVSLAVNLLSYSIGTFDIVGWKTNVSVLVLPLVASVFLHLCGHIDEDYAFALAYGLLLAVPIIAENMLHLIVLLLPMVGKTILFPASQVSYCLSFVLALSLLCGPSFIWGRRLALLLYSLARVLLFGVLSIYLQDRLVFIVLGIVPSFVLGAYILASNPVPVFSNRET